ncbi:hypothetical protein EVA_14064 [gut metagenome]|uniref:Uncharacterized protein n=1 Tax=gut metagenome TaxID=749906 RepID=J9GEP2_9ZZZZ
MEQLSVNQALVMVTIMMPGNNYSSNPQLNFQQLSNIFLPCVRVSCLPFFLL